SWSRHMSLPVLSLTPARHHSALPAFPTRRSSDLSTPQVVDLANTVIGAGAGRFRSAGLTLRGMRPPGPEPRLAEHPDEDAEAARSEEHTSELQSRFDLVCRLLLEKKKRNIQHIMS